MEKIPNVELTVCTVCSKTCFKNVEDTKPIICNGCRDMAESIYEIGKDNIKYSIEYKEITPEIIDFFNKVYIRYNWKRQEESHG